MIFQRPILNPHLHVEMIERQGVSLLSERHTILLNDSIYTYIVPLINGDHTVDEIVRQLEDKLPEAYIHYALMELGRQGYIVERESALPEELKIFCAHLNIPAQDAYQRLQHTPVSVRALDQLCAEELTATLESLHIQIAEAGKLQIVITDDYLRPELDVINQDNLSQSRPWMLVKPIGTLMWFGPLFKAGQTGCWACLAQRLRGNRPVADFVEKHRPSAAPVRPPLANLSAMRQAALSMAATEVFKWIVQAGETQLNSSLVTYDTLSLQTHTHALVKRPQCGSCGILGSSQSRPQPVILGSRRKLFTVDGGHRSLTPEETLARYQHHISPITGIVRELRRVSPDADGLTPTYAAKHHFASMLDDFKTLSQNLGGRSAGKGRSDVQARASAFCEAIERYSGVFQGDEIRIQGRYDKLGDKAIHPNACMAISQAQYDNREAWNAHCHSHFQRLPAPFDEQRNIEWTPLWSLVHQDFKYLPTAYCYFGYPKPAQPDCWADTNGSAAGNTLEEAILQGFMELVERDSVAIWWYNRLSRPQVDLNSFAEPYFQDLIDFYRAMHRDLWVLDITSDLQIPTFAAISRRVDRETEDILLGFGAHFDPRLAVQRALTEVNQILPAVLSANADGTTQYATSADPPVLAWWKTATLANQPYLAPAANLISRTAADYPSVQHDDLLADIQYGQQIVAQRGMDLLVLDQTRPDIGLRVVKVVVPGLRHFWKRLGPGRLYDVPVQMGWRRDPLQETDLNPVPMWM